MSKFVMKNRPKKPTPTAQVIVEIGNYVTLSYLEECIEKFKEQNPDHTTRKMMLEAEGGDYKEATIYLTSPPQSQQLYETQLQTYNIELKAYKMWRVKHKTQIEKHKAAVKKATAKRKLENTMVRLVKELEDTETKLRKA